MITDNSEPVQHRVHRQQQQSNYTTPDEDDRIGKALELDDKEAMMQDIFNQVGQDGEQRQ